MVYLLDTNACIQLWQRKHERLRAHFIECSPADVAICSIVKAELLFGAMRSAQQVSNLALLQKLFAPLQSFDFDNNAAEHYAQIRADLTERGTLIGGNDLIIAAIARANHATLVTHNTREFARVDGLALVDWEI